MTGLWAACVGHGVCSGGDSADCPAIVIAVLHVLDSSLTMVNAWGAGVGCGWMLGQSSAEIGELVVARGSLHIANQDGSGIGGGLASRGQNEQSVRTIEIEDMVVDIATTGGACIGSGISESLAIAFSAVEVYCRNSTLRLSSVTGAGIGTGDAKVPQMTIGAYMSIADIRIEDCDISGGSTSASLIGGGLTASYVAFGGIMLANVSLSAVIDGGGSVIGTGLITRDGRVEITSIRIYDSTIRAAGECTCVGIGQLTAGAVGKVSEIAIFRSDFSVNVTGNHTAVGIGQITLAGASQAVETGSSASIGLILLEDVSGFFDAEAGAAIGLGSAVERELAPENSDAEESSVKLGSTHGVAAVELKSSARLALGNSDAEESVEKLALGSTDADSAIRLGSAFELAPGSAGAAAEIRNITIAHSRDLSLRSRRGAGIGTGLGLATSLVIRSILIIDSEISVSSDEGAAIGPSELGRLRPQTIGIESIRIINSRGTFTSRSTAAIGSTDMVGGIELTNVSLSVSGKFGFAASDHPDSLGVSFIGPVAIICNSSQATDPCVKSQKINFQGDDLNFVISSRSLGDRQGSERKAVLSGDVRIAYALPSLPHEVLDQSSLHFGRVIPSDKSLFNLSISSSNYSVNFDFDASSSQSFTVILPAPGSYRVTYVNHNNESIYGIVLDSETNRDVFLVADNERFIRRGRMMDTVPEPRFVFEPWHIFVIIIGTVLVGFIVWAIVLIVMDRTARVKTAPARRTSAADFAVNTMSSAAGIRSAFSDLAANRDGAEPEGPAVKAFGLSILREFRATSSAVDVGGWILWLFVRLIVLVMMLVIAYLGLVSFLFFSLLAIISFIVAMFTNTFCWSSESALADRLVLILMFFYMIPLFELIISLNITVITAFFSNLWDNLNLMAITAAIKFHGEGNSKLLSAFRFSWDFFYFATMGFLFVFCISSPSSNIPLHIAPAFAFVCLIVPLLSLIRPIIVAWHVFLFDRDNIELPAEEPDNGEVAQDHEKDPSKVKDCFDLNDEANECFEVHDEAKDGFDVNDEAKEEPLTGFAKFEKMTHSEMLVLFDPVGLLKDDTWISYLRSGVTALGRPQLSNWFTFIPSAAVFVIAAVVAGLDIARMNQNTSRHNSAFDAKNATLQTIIDGYDLGWEPIARPWDRRSGADIAGLVVRLLLVIALFPLNTLSHHAILFMSKHFKLLGTKHYSIRTAKLFGVLLLVVSIVAMIFGAVARALYPRYTVDNVVAGLGANWTCVNRSEQLFDDQHAICGQSVANWPLIQLAALPILAETGGSNSRYRQVRDYFQCLTDVGLVQEEINFSSESILAYNREEGKLAVGLTSIPFDANFAIYCENFLSSYYPEVLGIFVPFYSIAYANLLSTMLTATSQVLISGILGPNRLSSYYLDEAIITARWELEIVTDVFEALRLSAGRPVVVGHGANGLLAKALPFSYSPWRVSFESPVLEDSPIEALAREQDTQTSTPAIINYYTDGSIYALVDAQAVINNRISRSDSSPVIPPNPFETFCIVAAACAQDDRFDQFCNDVLDGEFNTVWNVLDRGRVF
jgi:hypothetical protein